MSYTYHEYWPMVSTGGPCAVCSRDKADAIHQPTLFDAQASQAGKDAGMDRAAEAKADLLAYARKIAVEVAESRPDRTCNADDVQAVLEKRGIGALTLGNAAGSLFRGKSWEFTGRFVKSARIHAHKNLLRVWRFLG